MKKLSSFKLSLAVISIFMLAGITACNKGYSRPEGWNSASLLQLQCGSSRGYSVEKLNADRLSKLQTNESIVTRNSLVKPAGDDAAEIAPEFSQFEDPVQLTKDCTTLKVTYTGPFINDSNDGISTSYKTVEGDLESLTPNSIVFKNKKYTVTVEKVLPDANTEKAAFQKAVAEEANGTSTVKISIVDLEKKTTAELKQEVKLLQAAH